MRYLTGGAKTAPEVIRERDLPSILAGYDKWGGELGLLAAHEKDTGAFIGWFTVRPEPDGPANEVELGYRLRQAAWGRAYATEGSGALVRAGVHAARGTPGLGGDDDGEPCFARGARQARDDPRRQRPHPPDMLMVEGAEGGGVRYEITEEQWLSRQRSLPELTGTASWSVFPRLVSEASAIGIGAGGSIAPTATG